MRLHRDQPIRSRVRTTSFKRKLCRDCITIRLPVGYADRFLGRIRAIVPQVALQHCLESVECHPDSDRTDVRSALVFLSRKVKRAMRML